YYLPVSSLPIYGGTDGREFSQQQRGLQAGADVVIATPGRLLAHLQTGRCDLSRVSFFILDEADRMLDMGFYDDIMAIAKHLPAKHQTMMFSATMPAKIKQMASKLLTSPVEVKTAISKPAEGIDQSIYLVPDAQKLTVLKSLFDAGFSKRVIIFAGSKIKVKDLTRELRRKGLMAAEMHSDLEQRQREGAMLAFRAGRTDILVATDIVARGIDIDDIAMVVNYDVPRDAEDYVHRIGRTARAGAGGKAVTLVNERDRSYLARIEHFLKTKIRREPWQVSLSEPTNPGTSRHKPAGKNSRKPTRKSAAPVQATPESATPATKSPAKKRHPRRRKPASPKQD
ncbi:MAG: DEAD/DEAH box helicase, partial [Muribaculaceae bacterium]|nr:DEAD/DEAH box helicase [Muribaculaceae bacterium]